MITTKPYPDIELAFDEESHIFYANGIRVLDSVTGITGIIDTSKPLMAWAVRMMAEDLIGKVKKGEVLTPIEIWESSNAYENKRKEAAGLGKDVHKWAEDYLLGREPQMPDDDKQVAAITAFMRWLKENKLEAEHVEKDVYSKEYNYAGRLDVAGKVNGNKAVIDLKTSKGIYPDMPIQVAGYQIAIEEMGFGPYKERWILRFDKKTGYPEAKKFTDAKRDKELFIHALRLRNGERSIKNLLKTGSTKSKKVGRI